MTITQYVEDKDLEALNHIKRWYLNRTIRTENIAEHSFLVSFFANVLVEDLCVDSVYAIDFKLRVVRLALLHDVDEMFTGDVPHQVKNNGINGAAIKEAMDDFAKQSIIEKWFDSSKSSKSIRHTILKKDEAVKSIVKVADWLSFLKFCNTEIIMGNQDFAEIKNYCKQGLRKQMLSSVEELSKIMYGSDNPGISFDFNVYEQHLLEN